MQPAPPDIEVWNAFKLGDRKAFNGLFGRFYSLLFQYGNKICRDRALLEDCIQELFLELWQSRAMTEIQSVRAYLLKALKNKIFKQLRQRQPDNGINEDNGFEISHENLLISSESHEEKKRLIINAINRLSARQREIIYLKLYKGLSYEEISDVMEINYQAARNLYSQAIKSLRIFLSGEQKLF